MYGSDNEKEYWESYPAHEVTLTHDFWIARTETTQAQFANWTDAYDTYPSVHKDCDTCPVEYVSLTEAAQYANAASTAGGLELCYTEDGLELVPSLADDPYTCLGYRLPEEAEWEYAARAGEAYDWAGSEKPEAVAWTSETSNTTHPVAELAPNAWGLYDMSGNVTEWTWNSWGLWKGDPETDPTGTDPKKWGDVRVWRGGSFNYYARMSTVYSRDGNHASTTYADLGFRLVRTVP
jgi:formylglycine-generating enzyme required for sulfatase activity